MNGQTGKFVGRLPVDESKVRKYKALYTAGISAILIPILYLLILFLDKVCAFNIDRHEIHPASSPIIWFIIALVSVVFAVKKAFSIVSKLKEEMNTATLEETAFEYEVFGSLNYTKKSDKFVRKESDGGIVDSLFDYFDKRSQDANAWEETLRKKPDGANSDAELHRIGRNDVVWTEPLRNRSGGAGSEADFLGDKSEEADPEDQFLYKD